MNHPRTLLKAIFLSSMPLVLPPRVGAQVIVLPSTETFSSGSEGLNSNPNSGTLDFNGITYTVDGTGGVALFGLSSFLGTSFSNVDGLGVIGDWNWSGSTARNAHTFTMAANGGVKFKLDSLDWVTGNGGPPTVFTITGFNGPTQMAQIIGLDLSLTTSMTYGSATLNQIDATNIGPGDDSGYGQHLVFSGSGWSSIDRLVLSATGNDILVALDNIQFSPAAVPEPEHFAGILGLGMFGWGLARRRRCRVKEVGR